jgi:DNA topoisomerase III
MIVVLAEKPSVARDIASVLGAHARHEGYLEGNGYRVTWAMGHLVGLAEPDAINPEWKRWSRAALPMLPERFPLIPLPSGRAQLRVVTRLLRDPSVASVIAATDAGREGELIFRYIYELTRCRKPWQRLWLSSLTPSAIRSALAGLSPGSRYDGLASAARARSQADWLVGMNLSRAYTLTSGTLFSVGRVQTPTLAMIVARDREIAEFVPEAYLEVEATFEHARGSYRGTYYPAPPNVLLDERGRLRAFRPLLARLPADGVLAEQVASRVRTGSARVAHVDRSLRSTPAPQLFDLTELQRRANQLYGFSAQKTLDAAQTLYERYKALSYPRTDSRHLSTEVAATLPEIVSSLAPHYPGLVAADSGKRPLGKRFVDDSKVGDHHALIPTTAVPAALPAGSAEARIYDLVCRRLLMAWHDDMIEAVTRVVTEVRTAERAPDLFATQGVALEQAGWSVLERARPADPNAKPKLPPGIARGDTPAVRGVVVHRKQTQPPKPHTEATLLGAMETAGRQLEDRALIEAMRESGLGTPATRAATIETLLSRGYIVREAKSLLSTPLGRALIAAVHPLVRSPEMTGRWEQRLRRMERGQDQLAAFMQDIEGYVREVVAAEAEKPAAPRARPPLKAAGRSARNNRSWRRTPKKTGATQRSPRRAPKPRKIIPRSRERVRDRRPCSRLGIRCRDADRWRAKLGAGRTQRK